MGCLAAGLDRRVSGWDDLPPNAPDGHCFQPNIFSRAVWLYFHFMLSLGMGEKMLAARGIVVNHEVVPDQAGRPWADKNG